MLSVQWGARLRRARQSKRLTQAQFGELVGRDQTSVSRYERGDATWTLEVMLRFAAVLGMRVPDLFEWPFGIEDMELYGLERMKAAS